MVFPIKDKVALITGGASGIGLSIATEILRNGAKGIVIADTNLELGTKIKECLQKEYGLNKCIFIQTDIRDYNQFEVAFQKTVDHFGNVDILFNNAGVSCGKLWEQEIEVNLKGTIHGMLLGFDKFLSKYKQGDEAVIVNTSSILGVNAFCSFPVYSATKSGVLSLVKSYGIQEFYEETKVRVVGICPGATATLISKDHTIRYLSDRYERASETFLANLSYQESDFVAKETIKILTYASNGTTWIIEDSEPAYEYVFPDRKTMKQNILQIK